MNRSCSLPLAFLSLTCASIVPSLATAAGVAPAPAQLAMSSLIEYSRLIQGAQDPVYAYVYNQAPPGSDTANYKVYATYPYGTPFSYTGAKLADGGTSFITLPFTFDSSQVAPATNIPISVTGINTAIGDSLTQSGTVTVLAHAAPALLLQGQIVYLTSKATVAFTTDAFSQVASGGTELPGGFNPGMLGDPPGLPTAELDLDSIITSGSPFITTTLSPFIDLPANDNPAEALQFEIDLIAPTLGDYTTTFFLHYSDEQDLPGAAPPGSELLSFTVEANLDAKFIHWTVTTVPEPTSWRLLAAALSSCALFSLFRHRYAKNNELVDRARAPIWPRVNTRGASGITAAPRRRRVAGRRKPPVIEN
jgi:hypothetical protein